MNKKLLFSRLFVLVAAMMCALGVQAQEAYACYTPSNSTLTFYYDNMRYTRPGTAYGLNEGSNNPDWYLDGTYANVAKVVFAPSFANVRPTSTYAWFYKMENLTEIIGIENLDTRDVTTMRSMFNSCSSLTSIDLSHFNTGNVTSMAAMFLSCSSLTALDLSHINTAKVTDMNYMFGVCSGLASLDVSSFNTAKVTNMMYMFSWCSNLTGLDLSNFNTTNVTDMSFMFYIDGNLASLDVSSFDTRNVTNMGRMFYKCGSLTTLDLSSFNTAKVTDMDYMFSYDSNLGTIYASDAWSTSAVETAAYMLYDCTSLVGGQGTEYDPSHYDVTYAHIDGGPSNPGYFSEKTSGLRGDVNGDNEVTIADVSALIDYLLTGDATDINLAGADCNTDNDVTIADVSSLIDMLLGA